MRNTGKVVVAFCIAAGVAVGATALATSASATGSSRTAAPTGKCSIKGTANFKPGLKATAAKNTYTFSGSLSGCTGTYKKIKSGKITASGGGSNLSCVGGSSSGKATIVWNTGQKSLLSFTTSGTANMVTVTGKVTGGNVFVGDKASGKLTFTVSNPTQCAVGGVKSAPFSGSASVS